MPAIEVRITNLAAIRAAFGKAPDLMVTELNRAIRLTTLNIQRHSMINTPVLTGRLRASTQSKFTNLTGEVGTHTDYDVFVHNGTRFMAARPYLRDAVQEVSEETIGFFQRAVQNVLDKIGETV